ASYREMRHVVQGDNAPSLSLHRNRMNPTIVGLKSPFPSAVKPHGAQPYSRADPTVRHHNEALCLCHGQNFLDGLHCSVIKLPPRLSSGWGYIVWIGTPGGIDFWITLPNLRR